MITVEKRVSRLEKVLANFIQFVQKDIEESKKSRERSEKEMKEFKDEMKEFKDEMKEFKDEMLEFKDEMKEFKDEMLEFKDEMKGFKYEINKKWGELSHKMGTLVEDIVMPNLPFIAEKHFGLKKEDLILSMSNPHKKKPGDKHFTKEFDAILVYETKIVLNETKSTPRISYVNDFVKSLEKKEFFEYFPEYKGYEIIPVFSALSIPENIVKHLTRHKIYAMAMNEGTMQLLNFV